MGNQEKVSGTEETVRPSDNGWARRNLADALGDDEADVVISYDRGFQKDQRFSFDRRQTSPSDISLLYFLFLVSSRYCSFLFANAWDFLLAAVRTITSWKMNLQDHLKESEDLF